MGALWALPSPCGQAGSAYDLGGEIDIGQRALWGAAGHPGAEDSQAWPCYFFAS